VRITTVFRRFLRVQETIVESVDVAPEGLYLQVRPRWRSPRCGCCGRKAAGYDRAEARAWRHLSLGQMSVHLIYAPRRVDCGRCGVKGEALPWAKGNTRFTLEFEELAAYLTQVTDKTKVTELMGIAWQTVGSIVERVVARNLDPGRLDGLRSIGVDEFSYRKRHRYLTIVVDHDRKRVIWAAEGKSAETLQKFFAELGPTRSGNLKNVTIDMSEAYVKAVTAAAPQAKIIFDRFHVQRLASDALDEVRRSMVRELDDQEEASAIKGTRFTLLKNPWNLTRSQAQKLSRVQATNKRLYRGYLLKETLARALDYVQPARAEKTLREWLGWASRSKLKPFVKTARTVRKHFDGILAYVKERLTNGFTEGINTKLRMITRRAFGFHSAASLVAMLFLTCGGITLAPPLPSTHPQVP